MDIYEGKIENAQDATAWVLALADAEMLFHFEDGAENIINGNTGKRLFTDAQAVKIEAQLARVHATGVDPFEVALDELERRGDIERD
jgi:hypothetical protein